MLEALQTGGQGQTVDRLGGHGHFGELGADVSRLAHAHHVGDEAGSAAQGRTAARLTAAGGQAVDGGEVAQETAHILGLAAQEDPLVGDEDLVKVDHGLVVGVGLAQVDALNVALHLKEALILGRTAQNEGHARRVGGDGAGQGKVLILRLHVGGGDDDHFVGKENAGLVALEAADDDAVLPDLVHVDVAVPVGLLMGGNGAQTLDVRHGDGTAQVVVLHIAQEVHEALKVVGAQILVHVVGTGAQSGEGFGAGAAVGTAADDLGQSTGGAGFLVGVGGAGEGGVIDAHRFAAQVGLGGDEGGPLGVMLELVDLGDGVEAGGQGRIGGKVLDLLAQEPDVHRLAGTDAVLILFSRHKGHDQYLLLWSVGFASSAPIISKRRAKPPNHWETRNTKKRPFPLMHDCIGRKGSSFRKS